MFVIQRGGAKKERVMTETGAHPRKMSVAESMRRCADMLCLWRICGDAVCRRAHACRGRAHLCVRRNFRALPEGAREFFETFLAAKYAGLSFDAFKEEMEGSEEFAAFTA